jgi:hypothetical protein
MAGKGDKPRPTNLKKYRDNYDSIVWSKPKQNKDQKNNKSKS